MLFAIGVVVAVNSIVILMAKDSLRAQDAIFSFILSMLHLSDTRDFAGIYSLLHAPLKDCYIFLNEP